MCPYKINQKEDLAKSSWLWEMTLGRTAGSPLPGLHEARPQGSVRLRGTQSARLPSEVVHFLIKAQRNPWRWNCTHLR